MARGDNPNSRKNLIVNSERTPKERKEQARIAGEASGKARAAYATYFDVSLEDVTEEDIRAQIKVLKALALDGDIRAIELLMKIRKEYENKVSVEGNGIEIKVHNVE